MEFAASLNWILIVAGALMILLEVAMGGFTGFDLVLIGSTFLLGGAAGLALQSAPLGFSLAAILCVAYIILGRGWVRSRMVRPSLPSNVDAIIGRKGRVVQRIAPHEPGRIKLGDEEWRAVLDAEVEAAIEEGSEVTVRSVDGVTLIVR